MKALSQTPDRVTGVLEVLEMITGEFKDSAGDSMMGSSRVFHELYDVLGPVLGFMDEFLRCLMGRVVLKEVPRLLQGFSGGTEEVPRDLLVFPGGVQDNPGL